ncbi:hypothetical protein ACK3TF_006039 [Chlorella vulgaris]
MSKLVDGIVEAQGLSESSKAQYLEKLSTLTKLTGQSLEWILDHPEEVYAAILKSYTSSSTHRAFIAAIKAVYHYNEGLQASKHAAYEKYAEYQAIASQVLQDRYMNAEPSDRERKNWVPWAEVLAKERELAATQCGSTDHLLLAMYCLIEPLRQDFGKLRVLLDRMPPSDSTRNFLAIARDGSWGKLILNQYKTAKHYSTFERDLPPNLLRIIKASLIAHPRRYLFVTEHGLPYEKSNSFTQFSNRVLKRLFGRAFTVSMMRHSRISSIDFNVSTPGQLFSTAHNMRHSLATQQLYRRQVTPLPPPQPAAAVTDPTDSHQGRITHGSNGERFIQLAL